VLGLREGSLLLLYCGVEGGSRGGVDRRSRDRWSNSYSREILQLHTGISSGTNTGTKES
tara:strand:- start:1321 stop:1497 length:177 start_codon:yes stop_codon:yes gene_type:complete